MRKNKLFCLKFLLFLAPDRLRIHVQPSVFINFRGDCPRTPENAFVPLALEFGASALSCPQKVHIFLLGQKGPYFSPLAPLMFFSELPPWFSAVQHGFIGVENPYLIGIDSKSIPCPEGTRMYILPCDIPTLHGCSYFLRVFETPSKPFLSRIWTFFI